MGQGIVVGGIGYILVYCKNIIERIKTIAFKELVI